MELNIQLGQHLCAGFDGLSLTADLKQRLRDTKVGNIILFARNIDTKAQTRALCEDIHNTVLAATGYPPFIFIDQEGGVVSRLGEDCAVMPSAMGLAATGDPENAYRAALITARELRALGINFNLAPVMDINSNPQNPVIGVRSFGDSPELATPYILASLRGYRDGGVLSCAKHFPGHGDTAVDSHLGLPKIDKSQEALEACELMPFRAGIRAGVPAVMSSHILFPQIEPEKLPATMSRRVMTGLLKERLGFSGLVVSDCMMMRAIADHYGSLEGILSAIKAGVDLVFTSHSIDLAEEAIRSLREEWEGGSLNREALEVSTAKILSLKASLPKDAPPALDTVGSLEHRAVAASLYEQSLTAIHLPQGRLPTLGENPLFISCRPFAATLASTVSAREHTFHGLLAKRFSGTALEMGENPGSEEIARLAGTAKQHSCVVVGTYNGHLRAGQLELVRALAQTCEKVICVALRNPYDGFGLPENVAAIAAWSYTVPALEAAAKLLAGEIPLKGRLPLSY